MRKKAFIIILTVFAAGAGLCWFAFGQASGTPALALSFSHYETNHGVVVGVVRLTNSGTRAASYSSHSFGSDSPFYSVMAHSPTGWASAMVGWCGSESHQSILAAGSHTTFSVYLQTNQTWKVGVRYTDAMVEDRAGSFAPRLWRRYLSRFSSATRATYTVWSQPIKYDTQE
jgi:hypothetical protein